MKTFKHTRNSSVMSRLFLLLVFATALSMAGCNKGESAQGGKPDADAIKKFRGADNINEVPPKYQEMVRQYQKQNQGNKAPAAPKNDPTK